jgi:hypothetical protein
MNDKNGARLDGLRAREKELRAKIAAEQIRMARRKEKDDAKIFSIVGAALVRENNVEFIKTLLQSAEGLSDSDKKLLRARGWMV